MKQDDFNKLTAPEKLEAVYDQMSRIVTHLESGSNTLNSAHSEYRKDIATLFNRMIRVELVCALLLFMASTSFVAVIGFLIKLAFAGKSATP